MPRRRYDVQVEVRADATGPLAQVGDVTQGLVQEVVEELALDPALGLCDRPAKEQQECRDERRPLEGALVGLVELVVAVQQTGSRELRVRPSRRPPTSRRVVPLGRRCGQSR